MRMHEISTQVLGGMTELFFGSQLDMVVKSITAENTRGRLWTCDPAAPAALSVLWDQGNNKFYLTGHSPPADAGGTLRRLAEEEICPAALAGKAPYFGVRAVTAETEGLVEQAFAGFLRRRSDSLLYGLPVDSSKPPAASEVQGARIVPIDREFFVDNAADGTEPVLREIRWMWPSLNRYLQEGWGSAALVDDEVVCWCTAEYVSACYSGIGIETVPHMQNRGLATATAARFVAQTLRLGRRPRWECSIENGASVRVAEKLGLQVLEKLCFRQGYFSSAPLQ